MTFDSPMKQMTTQLFLRSSSKEYLSFHVQYFNTGVINRKDDMKRILSSCSSFPAAKQNLAHHAKLPLPHLREILAHNTAASSVKSQPLQIRLPVFLKAWQWSRTLQGSIYTERKLCESCGFLMLLCLIAERVTASLMKHLPYQSVGYPVLWFPPLNRNLLLFP